MSEKILSFTNLSAFLVLVSQWSCSVVSDSAIPWTIACQATPYYLCLIFYFLLPVFSCPWSCWYVFFNFYFVLASHLHTTVLCGLFFFITCIVSFLLWPLCSLLFFFPPCSQYKYLLWIDWLVDSSWFRHLLAWDRGMGKGFRKGWGSPLWGLKPCLAVWFCPFDFSWKDKLTICFEQANAVFCGFNVWKGPLARKP